MSITITLNQVKHKKSAMEGWDKVIDMNGGTKADFNAPFPLSTVLDLNGIEYAIWCFKCLPEHKSTLTKFALFCAKEVCMYADDKRVYDCINAGEEYLKGNADLKTLRKVRKVAVAYACKPDITVIASNAARTAIYAVDTILVDDYTSAAFRASDGAVTAYCQTNAYLDKVCSCSDAHDAEIQRQTDYLRKLLVG